VQAVFPVQAQQRGDRIVLLRRAAGKAAD